VAWFLAWLEGRDVEVLYVENPADFSFSANFTLAIAVSNAVAWIKAASLAVA
jgi:hypothetical protein